MGKKVVINNARVLKDVETGDTFVQCGCGDNLVPIGGSGGSSGSSGSSIAVKAEPGQALLASEIDENGNVTAWQAVTLNADKLVYLTTLDAELLNAGGVYPSIGFANGVIIPEGTTFVSADAFSGKIIKEVRLNAIDPTFGINEETGHVGTIYKSPFYSTNVAEVQFGSSTEISDYLFYSCNYLEKFEAEYGTVKKIGSHAFDNCAVIEDFGVVFYHTEEIGEYAFAHCTSLTDINLPSVWEFPDYAFYGCRNLKTLNKSLGVTRIGNYAFASCAFESFDCTVNNMSNTLTEIGDYAFHGCSYLKKVIIPESTTSIGVNAFQFCAEDFEIHGFAGSYAETYANEHGITFVAVTADDFNSM